MSNIKEGDKIRMVESGKIYGPYVDKLSADAMNHINKVVGPTYKKVRNWYKLIQWAILAGILLIIIFNLIR